MKEITSIALVLVAIYLLASAFLYVFQRKLIYFPMPIDAAFSATEITLDNRGIELQGWVLNPGKEKAMIYFGGNSELITHRAAFFTEVFRDYSVYLINYRGYGNSEGKPSEKGLFSDAVAIYDHIEAQHQSILAYGRSLGSGVAVYLASQRNLERLILLTPYDSVAEVAQVIYPIFPVRYLIRDRFDSVSRTPDIEIPVLVAIAQQDHEITPRHSQALIASLKQADLQVVEISGASHNDIVEFSAYREAIGEFLSRQ